MVAHRAEEVSDEDVVRVGVHDTPLHLEAHHARARRPVQGEAHTREWHTCLGPCLPVWGASPVWLTALVTLCSLTYFTGSEIATVTRQSECVGHELPARSVVVTD